MRTHKGFTLIELFLVIGIILILAAIVVVAINPARKQGDERDQQRRSDVTAILNAVFSYAVDNGGNLPENIPTITPKEICTTTAKTCTNGVDLKMLVGSFITQIPADPTASTTGTGTLYTIVQDSNGHVTVSALRAEQAASISVTR